MPLPIPGHCESCRKSIPPYEVMRSWAVFDGPIRQALHQIKYYRNISLADELSKRLAEYVVNLNWQVDAVVPVPLGKERKRERGYNQVGLVAMRLAEVNDWRYIPQAVVRSRETRSQVGLSIAERKENVSGAFYGKAAIVSKTSILLVDDVATTGATLSACAEALLEAGARSVYALTIARALPHQVSNIV